MPDLPRHAMELASGFQDEGILSLIPILSLVAVNWTAEALKWKCLLQPVHLIGYGRAIRSVLAGVALSVATPNRIGEYGARILYIPEGKRLQAVSLSMMGGLAQLVTTLSAGLMAFVIPGEQLAKSLSNAGFTEGLRWTVVLLTSAFIIFCILLILRIDAVLRIATRWPLIGRWAHHFTALGQLSPTQWATVCGLSILRYAIFILQYILMLKAMQVDIGWVDGCRAVAFFFFLMSVVPSIALLELGMRWQYSIFVFGIFSPNILGICAASTGIWLVNLALPASIGTVLMLGVRIRTNMHSPPTKS